MRAIANLAWVVCLAGALALAPPAQAATPDPWITAKVKLQLLTSDEVNGLDVNVDTINGRVTLHGVVDAQAEKERAGYLARGVDGVADVRNLIRVVPASEQAAVRSDDDEIRSQVETVLQRDAALAGSEIRVESVNEGVVLLAGNARTLSAHVRALEDARAVPSVRRVASQIESPDTLSDAEIWREGKPGEDAPAADRRLDAAAQDLWITTRAKFELMANPSVDALDVNVDVRDAVVTLFGIVESDATREAAEDEVRDIDGVRRVENQLQVVPDARRAEVAEQDDAISQRIEAELAAHPQLEGAKIDVGVKAGVARLTGRVESQEQRLVAVTLARATPGVRAAVDDLAVASGVSAGPPAEE